MRRTILLAIALVLCAPLPATSQSAGPRRIILEPSAGTIFTFEGLLPQPRGETCDAKRPRPLRAKYRGAIEISASGGRLRVINTLSFSEYLRGIAEVPPSWPRAALRAQAIAARSYALDAIRRGAGTAAQRGYDICATDQCQVYRGAAIELGAFGERWVSAVEGTKGKVLTHDGRVIQAFYFSTSDGRTRSSFPGGTPQPWLPSVPARDDDAPLAHWTARIPFSDLTTILSRAGSWSGGRIASAREVSTGVRLSDGTRTSTIAKTTLRQALNAEAACAFPGRYPTLGSQTGTRLPLTVPGPSFTARQDNRVLVLQGRGWGHNVGMSQWGARSLAARGWSAGRILRYYYGVARINTVEEPEAIRVLAADGLRIARISAEGLFDARTDTGSRLAAGPLDIRAVGNRLRVQRGSGPALAPVLSLDATLASDGPFAPGSTATVRVSLPKSTRVRAEVLGNDDRVVAEVEERSYTAERPVVLEVPLIDLEGRPLEPGEYDVVVEGTDGIDTVRAEPVAIVVAASGAPPDAAEPDDDSSAALIAAAAALAIGAAAAIAWWLRRRRT